MLSLILNFSINRENMYENKNKNSEVHKRKRPFPKQIGYLNCRKNWPKRLGNPAAQYAVVANRGLVIRVMDFSKVTYCSVTLK